MAKANATINALLGSSIGRFPVGYIGDTTSDMVGVNLGMPGTYEGDVTFENLGTPGTYEGDVEFENLGTPLFSPNPLIPAPLPAPSFSIPRGPTLKGYVPGGRTGLDAFSALPGYEQSFIREQGRSPTRSERETGVWDATPQDEFDTWRPGEWHFNIPTPDPYNVQGDLIQAGLSPEIESRIQQDASRGLFDVNERSVAQLRSPFPPTNTTPTTERMIRALKNPLKVDVPRPTGGGGGLFAGLGGLLSGAAPWAAALGLGLPLGMMWPSKISEKQGIVPESGPLTPQQLFKMRNDAEELRLIEGGVPVIPEVPEWNPQASIPPDFRVNERSMASLSRTPNVIYIRPPVASPFGPVETPEVWRARQESEARAVVEADRMATKGALEELVEPFVKPYTKSGAAGQPELQALSQLAQIDPTLAERYAPGSQALQDITSQVESFEGAPGTTWTQSVPDISDILKTYVPPKAAQEPYVEQFEEITPPKKVVKKKVKKKVKKAKPGPKKAKVKAKVSKAPPRRVKYTPPKPKSKTPVTRRKGGKPKVRRVSKAPTRPGGR